MMREPIRLACESLRKDGGKNMGQCVELFALASDEDEARALTQAYASYLMIANAINEREADALARKNILVGTSYMDAEAAHDLYSFVFAKAGE